MEKNVFARSANGVKYEVGWGGGVYFLTPCTPTAYDYITSKRFLDFHSHRRMGKIIGTHFNKKCIFKMLSKILGSD